MLNNEPDIAPLKFVLPASLVFFAVSAIGIFHHQLWLDEAQHFLIGRDSNSLSSLYTNMQYDGHVRLWNYLLFFITHYISANPLGMQIFHLVIIALTAYVFLRYAPFDIFTKLLVISGYFFVFEYNQLSRNYALGILFLFICCRLLKNEKQNMWWIGLLLFLMANTHLFFSFAAAGIFFYLLYLRLTQRNLNSRFLILTIFFGAAICSVAIQMHIPPDNGYFHLEKMDWLAHENIVAPLYGYAKGFLPVPVANHGDFWNHFLYDRLGSFLKLLIAFSLIVYLVLLLRRSKSALLFYCSSVILLLIFLYLGQSRAARYFGMCFIFFISASWLAGNENITVFSINKFRNEPLKAILFFGPIYFILLCNIFSGVYAYSASIMRPFTEARNVTEFVGSINHGLEPVVVDGYGGLPTLSAYFGKQLFCLDIDQFGSYCIWKQSYFKIPRPPISIELTQSTYIRTQNDFILVSLRTIPENDIRCTNVVYHLQQLKAFTEGIIRPDYYVYKVTKIATPN